jgi:hypothetical protein
MQSRYKSKGFVGVVFLAIALIAIVLGAFAAMSRGSASNSATEKAKTDAAVLIKRLSDFKTTHDRMIASGIPETVSITAVWQNGLRPNATAAPEFQNDFLGPPPKTASGGVAPNGYDISYWTGSSIVLPGIGSNLPDRFFYVGPISLTVCQAVNTLLYKDAISASPATSVVPWGTWYSINGNISEPSTAANFKDRPEGCIRTSDGVYLHYKVYLEQ